MSNFRHEKLEWLKQEILDILSFLKTEFNEINHVSNLFDENFFVDNLFRYRKYEIDRIPTMQFDYVKNSWIRIRNQKFINTIETLNNFSTLTYNVWFSGHNFVNRRNAILEILKEKNPDVISLQEVTSTFFNVLLENNFIRENYYISDSYINSYNVIMLSKFPMKFYILYFPTKMYRNLIVGEVRVKSFEKSSSVVFSSSHFESLDNQEIREIQLEKSFSLLNLFKNSLLIGDFNIDDKLQENEIQHIDSNYTDTWVTWKKFKNITNDTGYTYYEDKREPPQRIDRILINKYSFYKLKYFEIVGKQKIDVDPQFDFKITVTTPSDHQGLFAKFDLENK